MRRQLAGMRSSSESIAGNIAKMMRIGKGESVTVAAQTMPKLYPRRGDKEGNSWGGKGFWLVSLMFLLRMRSQYRLLINIIHGRPQAVACWANSIAIGV